MTERSAVAVRATTREWCKRCDRESAVGFSVPNYTWTLATSGTGHQLDTLCIACFAELADARGLRWDRRIEFYPVSLRSHEEVP